MTNFTTNNNLILYWIVFALVLFPMLFFIKQPYGKHFQNGWGPSISNRIGWVIMEIPSLLILCYFFIIYRNFTSAAALLFLLWIIHYFNRTLVFPFRIKTKGKKMLKKNSLKSQNKREKKNSWSTATSVRLVSLCVCP